MPGKRSRKEAAGSKHCRKAPLGAGPGIRGLPAARSTLVRPPRPPSRWPLEKPGETDSFQYRGDETEKFGGRTRRVTNGGQFESPLWVLAPTAEKAPNFAKAVISRAATWRQGPTSICRSMTGNEHIPLPD